MFDIKPEPSRKSLVKSLKIAAPCPVSWDSMQGDERVRHCSKCDKNVYNISEMTEVEANEFLLLTGQKACVNFYQRADGTLLLDNCPVGLRRLRAHYRRMVAAGATIISLAQGLFLMVLSGEPGKDKTNCSSNNTPQAGSGHFIRGSMAPVSNLGGAPAPISRITATKSYEDNVVSRLAAAMPKNVDLGSAAIALTVGTDGSIKALRLVNKSPSRESDKLILDSVRSLKFSPLPAEFCPPNQLGATLPIYFECRQAAR